MHQALTSPLTLNLILKLVLLGFLTLASSVFSVLAVGAFWWSWKTGGEVEIEGWLTYGYVFHLRSVSMFADPMDRAKTHRTPHAVVVLPMNRFQEDLRYDVMVEMELVRPSRGQEEMGEWPEIVL
jgi:hypothetical protein